MQVKIRVVEGCWRVSFHCSRLNTAHNGVKEFTVSAADLTEDAKLTCTLTGTSPDYGTVYVDENMNLIHAPAEADANDTLHLENGILSVETPVNEYELNGNVLSIVRHRLNGSVTAEAWVYTAAPEKLVEFKYDSNGLRTQKKVTDHGQTVTTDYIYHSKKLVGLTCGNDTLHFFYDAQGRPVQISYNGVLYTYVYSLQGDIVGIHDSSGITVVECEYNAWGILSVIQEPIVIKLRSYNPFYYRGYIYDEDIALYYLLNRCYSPHMGRFINEDDVLEVGTNLISGNLYAYCKNSLPNMADKNGRLAEKLVNYLNSYECALTMLIIRRFVEQKWPNRFKRAAELQQYVPSNARLASITPGWRYYSKQDKIADQLLDGKKLILGLLDNDLLEGGFELADTLINGGNADLNVGHYMTITYVFERDFSISDPYNPDERVNYTEYWYFTEYFNAQPGDDYLDGGHYNPATGLWGIYSYE